MNKQALCQTGLFLKGKGEYMNRTSKMGALFQDGFLVSGLDFPGRISAGTKLTCNSFLIQCKLAFILINVHFSLFFPWF